MKRRVLATLLVGIMAASMLSGCGKSTTSKEKVETLVTEAPKVEESKKEEPKKEEPKVEDPVAEKLTYPVSSDVELSMYILTGLALSSAYTDFNDVPFLQGLAEKTGFHVKYESASVGADADTAFNLMLQEEKLPSILYGNLGAPKRTKDLYDDGVIVDLTEYLPTYAPDFWEYIHSEGHEADLELLTRNDGKIFCFPWLPEKENITYLGPVVRQDWLDELGLEVPVTMDDWEKTLIAFKDKYNAKLVFPISAGRGRDVFIAGGTGAFAAFTTNWYVDDDKVIFANSQDEWKDFLTYMKRWYDMGLLDPDFATGGDGTTREAALAGKVGISFTAMSQLTNWIKDAEAEGVSSNWVGIPYPVPNKGDKCKYIQTRRQSWDGSFGAVITTSCSEEEIIAACQFLNYGYEKEGMKYWNFGEEGKTYTMDANGHVTYTDLITKDERGISEAMKDYTGQYSAGIGVQLREQMVSKNLPIVGEAQRIWTENTDASKYYVTSFARTDEESTIYSDAISMINTYVNEMALKFITGDADINAFDAYVQKLNDMGLEKCIQINQAAYDRYMGK